MTTTLLCIAAAMAAGLVLNRLAKLVSLPNVTGYLIAGLLIGPSCFALIPEGSLSSLDPFVTVALGFIAYSIGSEFKLSTIKAIGTKSITITLFQAMTAVLLVDAAIFACGFDLPLALTLGAIAAATAPAATLMVVRQYKAKGPVTQTLLPVVAMDDAVGLIVFAISMSLAQTLSAGGDMSVATMLLEPLLEIVESLGLGAAIGFVLCVALRFFHSKDNFLCISILGVLAGVGLSELFGLSNLLLCMASGAMVCNLRKDSEGLMDGIDRWTPPLFMLFFVISGAELDLAAIPTVGILGVVYLLARSLGKYFGTFVGSGLVHADANVKKYLGFALLPQAGVAIGMAQMCAVDLPEYAKQITTVVLCATLVYELVGPVVTKIALEKAGEITVSPKAKRTKKNKTAA